MKKIISLVGALFLGTMAMGQSTKPDTTKKTTTKKVAPSDVKKTSDTTGQNKRDGTAGAKAGSSKK